MNNTKKIAMIAGCTLITIVSGTFLVLRHTGRERQTDSAKHMTQAQANEGTLLRKEFVALPRSAYRDTPDSGTAGTAEAIASRVPGLETGLSESDSAQIASLSFELVNIILDSDYDAWASFVRSYALDDSPVLASLDKPEFEELWRKAAIALDHAPTAPDKVHGRFVEPDIGIPDLLQTGTVVAGTTNSYRARFVDNAILSGPQARAFEVFIPVVVLDARSEDVRGTLGLRFVQTAPNERWKPLATTTYFGPEGFEHPLMMMPY